MKILPLSTAEKGRTGFTHKINITFADIAAAALTNTIPVFPDTGTFGAGTLVIRTALKVKTLFSGGTVATMTVSVGDSGSGTRYHSAVNIFTGATVKTIAGTVPYGYSATDYVRALFTSTVGNLNALTAGELDLYIHVQQLGDLDNN
jgi:hypothetical protein